VAPAELFGVSRCHFAQGHVDAASGDGETPERVTELRCQCVTIEGARLHDVFAHVRQRFPSLFRETRCRVEEALLIIESWIDRSRGGVLKRVEIVRGAHA